MHSKNKTLLIVIVGLIAVTSLTGCTNWKKKYEALNVEHQNVKGLLEREQAAKGQLTTELTQGQQTIAELQRKIEELKQSPAEASGFGEGYDVGFDASVEG